MNELKRRGRSDRHRRRPEGLDAGASAYAHPEAIPAVFAQAQVQTCVVHLIWHSLAFVSYKGRQP
jgi:putative transposase